ncbi:methenyltetrahydromethanopterin cyclohydrolase [Blastopirellula sp. JC732]|uniref:Methenyltetrahydromethanopterin cyclohydrolase n=1 Tax=Blastopirellula sediminis TaxID=2894196 RepID=A0A9X1SEZ4_9BACT|nr:methenyltetrahydromethanopterin cyclohydrolase [Blastopirellula sediminis]MCC9608803.1 methenyltetrahydromethanopterin cyclohydrolase [Blastopirellula sediminis]MCC9628420.1 methenyltetrahydromethanopterin cyclohydrolase [Blastopirellula sediminis]
MNLNQRAWAAAQAIIDQPEQYQAIVHESPCGTQILDLGIGAAGGQSAGLKLAEVCLSGLGEVKFTLGSLAGVPLDVHVKTDQPVVACMGSQYAGWKVLHGEFFAMASGPMRALAGKEPLIAELGLAESADVAVGVLETAQLPPEEVCVEIAKQCGVQPNQLRLLVARTASVAGHVQIVARSVETALHKLHELHFDLKKIVKAEGTAPLPPLAKNDVQGIGRTNDAILYGGHVTLWVDAEDEEISDVGRQLPSSSSPAFGTPFEKILRDAKFDFYQIDPMLFSPAQVTWINVNNDRLHSFGETSEALLRESFEL